MEPLTRKETHLPDNTANIVVKKDGEVIFHRFVILPDEDISLELFNDLMGRAFEDMKAIVGKPDL